jgi:hypothetical protein
MPTYTAQNGVKYDLTQFRFVGWLPEGNNVRNWEIILHYFDHRFITVPFTGTKPQVKEEVEMIHKMIKKI